MAERIQILAVKSDDGNIHVPLQASDGSWSILNHDGVYFYWNVEDLRGYMNLIKNDTDFPWDDEPDLIQAYELLASIMEEQHD